MPLISIQICHLWHLLQLPHFAVLAVTQRVNVQTACNKKNRHIKTPGFQNNDISKNFSSTFMPEKNRRAVLPLPAETTVCLEGC